MYINMKKYCLKDCILIVALGTIFKEFIYWCAGHEPASLTLQQIHITELHFSLH